MKYPYKLKCGGNPRKLGIIINGEWNMRKFHSHCEGCRECRQYLKHTEVAKMKTIRRPPRKSQEQIGVRIMPEVAKWFDQNFKSMYKGTQYVIEAWPSLYVALTDELKGVFDHGEAIMIIDACRIRKLEAAFGNNLYSYLSDTMNVLRLHEKWDVDKEVVLMKVDNLTPAQQLALEIWACTYWDARRYENVDWDEYADGIAQPGMFVDEEAQIDEAAEKLAALINGG